MHRLSQAAAFVAIAAVAANAQSTGGSNPTEGSSTSTVLLSLAINAAIALGMVTAFILLRPRFPKIYRPKSFLGPKEERVEPLPDSLFGWIVPYLKRPTTDIIESNGLDAFMFVDYIEMMIWILGPIFIFTWALLLPVYGANTTAGKQGFQLLTFGQVGDSHTQQLRYIAPLLVQYIITGWICFMIRKHVMRFIKLRQNFITSPKHANSTQARTLLITGVPNEFLGERKLKELYSHLPGGVERVWLNRDLGELPDLFDERLKALNKLEATEAKVAKLTNKKVKKNKVSEQGNEADDFVDRYLTQKERPTMKDGAKLGFFGGKKVDALTHLRAEVERLNKEIDSRRTDETDYKPANAAFLLFRTQVGCHMAKNMTPHHEPYKMSRRYIEAHPNEVIWGNLSMNPYAQKIRTAAFWAATFGFIGVWLPLIAFAAIVSNVNGLCASVPPLAWICQIPAPVLGIIKGFLPTVYIAVLNILLPIILRVFARLSGAPTSSEVELSLQKRMTWFNLIDNFLLFTIISGISGGVSRIIPVLSQPTQLPSLIAEFIPEANTFYISFIILQALSGAAGGLLQIAKLVIYYIKAFLLGSTARKTWHIHNDVPAPAWGTTFPAITLLTTVTFGYAVLAPLINGFAFVAFCLFWLLYKYLATYVWDMKPAAETSGLFFMHAIQASMAGLYVSQLILTVLFFVAQETNPAGGTSQSAIPEGVFMVILMVLTVAFHVVLFDSVGDLPTALPLSLLPSKDINGNGDERSQYGNGNSPNEKERLLTSGQATAAAPHMNNGGGATGVNVAGGRYPEQQDVQQSGSKGLANGQAGSGHGSTEQDEAYSAFTHPALRDPQRTLWFTRDRFGLSREAVARAQEHGLDATDEGAFYNEKGRIETDAYVPPGEKML